MINKPSLIFWLFENWNLEFVSNFGQFYKIRRASDLLKPFQYLVILLKIKFTMEYFHAAYEFRVVVCYAAFSGLLSILAGFLRL